MGLACIHPAMPLTVLLPHRVLSLLLVSLQLVVSLSLAAAVLYASH